MRALQAERMAQANSPAASQDALRTMMYLSRAQQCLTKATVALNNIKQRADKVHKEALELEKAVDVAAKMALQGITRCENTVVGAVLVLAYTDAVRETALSHEVHIWMF